MSEYSGLGLSLKIRKYLHGLLLLLLAGFIVSAVNYVVSTIPETDIVIDMPLSIRYTTPELVSVPQRGGCVGATPNYDVFIANLSDPPNGKKYMILFRDASRGLAYPRYFERLDIVVGSKVYPNVSTVKNNTHYFAEWYMGITSIYLYYSGFTICYPYPIYIYLVDSNMSLPPPPEVWYTDITVTTTIPVSMSNKLLLGFISWITGIALIIITLHKFDIFV